MTSPIPYATYRQFIVESSWFKGLPDSAIDILASEARVKYYSAESYLYRIGEKSVDAYCVINGKVRVSMRGSEGQEFAIGDLESGIWLGEGSLLSDKPRILEIRVIEGGQILVLPRAVVIATAELYPVVYRNLFEEASEKMRDCYEVFGGTIFLPLRARLAGRLLDLAKETGEINESGTLLECKLSQNDFATMSHGSRQHINKIFREWSANDVVTKAGCQHFLLNIQHLEKEQQLAVAI
ncbi:MAG: Crp/Fnr family transcriptional regulator [Halioglobus sp.]